MTHTSVRIHTLAKIGAPVNTQVTVNGMEALPVEDAWIGDAVLALYARLKILREEGQVDGEKSKRLTSNQFLAAFGEPTRVEAQIGRAYAKDGLAAAFGWIEQNLVPLFERQEENRKRGLSERPKGDDAADSVLLVALFD